MSLSVRTFGSGGRAAVALHCSLAQGSAWAGVAALLPGLTVRAPDLPGHGRSPHWDGAGDVHAQATRDVLALIDAPVDLIGHSFGATVALRVALERPDLVRTLVLVEPVLFAAARAAGDPAYAAHRAAHADFDRLSRAGDRRAAAAAFQDIWGEVRLAALPPRLQDYIVQRIHLITAADPALTEDTGGLLGHGRLESLGLPVLLVEGGASPPVIGAIQTELARRLPQVTRVVVPGAGHMVPITHAAPVAHAIGRLISALQGRDEGIDIRCGGAP
ncbi:MAG: alpha/beta fold hydrolase [Gemmobacter sp.]